MAAKKPLVMGSDGFPQQLQSGDTLLGASETGQVVQTASGALVAGNVVKTSANDTVAKAQADSSANAKVLGMCVAAISNAATGVVQMNGLITLTTSEWDAVAGTTGGLTAGTDYFLDPATAGKITSTPPTTAGQVVVWVGRALSTTELELQSFRPIKL